MFITTHSISLVEGVCEILGDEEYCKYRDATTWEWTPAILPNRVLDARLNADWYGLLTSLFGTGKNRKTVADINVRNPELGGTVGHPIDKHGNPAASRRSSGGLPAALTVAGNDPDQKAGRRSRSSPVRGDPSSRLHKAARVGVDGRSRPVEE